MSFYCRYKGNQSWIYIGRTDAETETPILWPPDAKNWLIGKDPDAGKDWGQEEKGKTEDDDWMASPTWWTWVWASSGSCWWTGKPGVLQSMGCKELDMTERLNWTTERRNSLCLGVNHWRRKWQPTPVFLPGESHGGRSLVGYSPWGRKESDTTERLHFRC